MHLRLGLLISLSWLILDQATKWWILEHVLAPPTVIPVTGFFNLVLGRNSGVSFGFLSGAPPWLLTLFTIGIVIGLLVWMAREQARSTVVALALIIGGAIGNIVDRLNHGAVTDFLDFHLGGYHWPAFNLADTGIVAGVTLLMADMVLAARKAKNEESQTITRDVG